MGKSIRRRNYLIEKQWLGEAGGPKEEASRSSRSCPMWCQLLPVMILQNETWQTVFKVKLICKTHIDLQEIKAESLSSTENGIILFSVRTVCMISETENTVIYLCQKNDIHTWKRTCFQPHSVKNVNSFHSLVLSLFWISSEKRWPFSQSWNGVEKVYSPA